MIVKWTVDLTLFDDLPAAQFRWEGPAVGRRDAIDKALTAYGMPTARFEIRNIYAEAKVKIFDGEDA